MKHNIFVSSFVNKTILIILIIINNNNKLDLVSCTVSDLSAESRVTQNRRYNFFSLPTA